VLCYAELSWNEVAPLLQYLRSLYHCGDDCLGDEARERVGGCMYCSFRGVIDKDAPLLATAIRFAGHGSSRLIVTPPPPRACAPTSLAVKPSLDSSYDRTTHDILGPVARCANHALTHQNLGFPIFFHVASLLPTYMLRPACFSRHPDPKR